MTPIQDIGGLSTDTPILVLFVLILNYHTFIRY